MEENSQNESRGEAGVEAPIGTLGRDDRILRWFQWAGALAGVLIALGIAVTTVERRCEAAHHARINAQLGMENTREQIEAYFDQLHSYLRLISLDREVQSLSASSEQYIRAVYDEDHDRRFFSEIYVVERDFDGTKPPIRTFEYGDAEHRAEELHSLENELEEYRVLIEHVERFAADPLLGGLIGPAVHLSVDGPGFVLSVPIRRDGVLTGVVAGMVRTRQITAVLEEATVRNQTVLTNERGDVFGCEDLSSDTRRWFAERVRGRNAARFFATRDDTFSVNRQTAVWTSVAMPDDQEWYVAFMYDPLAAIRTGGIVGVWSVYGGAAAALLLGAAVWALCRIVRALTVAREQIAARGVALADREARIRVILNTAADAVLTVDEHGIVESFNRAAEETFGYRADEIIGQDVSMLMPPPDSERHDEYLARYRRTGDPHIIGIGREVLGRRKNGEVFHLDLAVSEVILRDRRIFTGIARDIADRKVSESRVRDYACALESANEALRQATEEAEAASGIKSTFLANMSHEIRTPMTAILGFAESLSDDALTEAEKRDAVKTIRRNGELLLSIINGILDLSKIEAGKLDIEAIECSPRAVVEDVVELMRIRADAKGLRLDSTFEGTIPTCIVSDPTRVREILINLAGNAIKFTSEGAVTLVTRCVGEGDERRMQFDIVDTGIGMTPEQVAKLFQPFTQADSSTRRRFGGTGLGLTISKRLAEMLGGDVRVVESQPGVGTRLRCTIHPQVVAAADRAGDAPADGGSTTPPIADQAADRGEAPLANRRILLVEDGLDNRRLITRILKKAGAEVTTAEDGLIGVEEATKAVEEGRTFDCILMDMQMPVMDGYQATDRLRQDGYTGAVIALTAHAMSTDRKKCLDAGCDDFATKPIKRKELISLVASYVARSAPERQTHRVA